MNAIFQNFLFVLKRFRTSSIFNLLGLSVALTVFIISFLEAEYDFSYNTGFKKYRDIYELHSKMSNLDLDYPVITPYVGEKALKDFAEIKNYCAVSNASTETEFHRLNDETAIYKATFKEATAGFLDIFTPEIISGDATKVFGEQGYAMISEKMAKNIFGKENATGEVLIKNTDNTQLTIVAVYKDFSERSSLTNSIYSQAPESNDTPYDFTLNYFGYFEIDQSNLDALTEKINEKDWVEGFLGTWLSGWNFVPLNKVHHHTLDGGVSRNTTLSLLAIGVIILIISYINFINFSVALAPVRVRELNIRKILGEKDAKIRLKIASEAVLFSIIAFALAVFIISLIKDSFIGELLFADLSLEKNVSALITVGVLIVIAGFLIGLYPAIYTTAFRPATVLSGKFALSGKGVGLRNTLVTIQFFASIALIIVSIMIKMQHDFMHKESWKFERDNIVYVPTGKDMQYEAFMSALETNPDIVDYTYSAFLPGRLGMYHGGEYKGKVINIAAWPVAPDFPDFFGIPLAEGTKFSNDTTAQVIINRKAVTVFELDNVFGDTLINNSVVCGLVEDLSFLTLEKEIEPMGFMKKKPEEAMNYIFIKINGNNTLQAMDFIEQAWKKTHTGNFDIHFLDESFDQVYKKQENLAKLITIFGLIALLIALMGVYGIVLFNAKYKAKEIAIRRVNGSTIKDIILLLNRTILIQLAIAFLTATPVAYYLTDKWLESFAYKVAIHWWVFVVAGLTVLLVTLVTVGGQSYKSATANPTEALGKE
ncbi:MAG: FtsX-like permease family protein [Prevotellaceae bacterium]|jgi:putative ABC transport system permease protein|nr:FtsX-like permease family protein [Prevotellaceae bacterium]